MPNLLIYLEPDLQRRVLDVFSYSLHAAGVLVLGTSEGVTGFDDRFAVLDKRWKLFRRRQPAAPMLLGRPRRLLPRAVRSPGRTSASATDRNAGGTHVARPFAPPSAIVSERGELIYLHGQTGPFLERRRVSRRTTCSTWRAKACASSCRR